MKVLHVIGAFIAGGAEVFVTNLAITQKNNVSVYALSSRLDLVGEDLMGRLDRN